MFLQIKLSGKQSFTKVTFIYIYTLTMNFFNMLMKSLFLNKNPHVSQIICSFRSPKWLWSVSESARYFYKAPSPGPCNRFVWSSCIARLATVAVLPSCSAARVCDLVLSGFRDLSVLLLSAWLFGTGTVSGSWTF